MEKITRDIILDLLPIYAADEASDDTRKLVEAYLEENPDIKETVKSMKRIAEIEQIPSPLKKEDKMEAYNEAKHRINARIVTLAIIIAAFLGLAFTALVFLLFGISS